MHCIGFGSGCLCACRALENLFADCVRNVRQHGVKLYDASGRMVVNVYTLCGQLRVRIESVRNLENTRGANTETPAAKLLRETKREKYDYESYSGL